MHLQSGSSYRDIHCLSGNVIGSAYLSLGSFWQGVKIMVGDVKEALAEMTQNLFPILRTFKFVPEMTKVSSGESRKAMRPAYPLRPEAVESIWMAYSATRDPSLLVCYIQDLCA